MHFDLTNLTASQVAVLSAVAGLVATFVGVCGAMAVAIVNGLFARRIQHDNVAYAYRYEAFKPLVELLATRHAEMVILLRAWRDGRSLDYTSYDDAYQKLEVVGRAPFGEIHNNPRLQSCIDEDNEAISEAWDTLKTNQADAGFRSKVFDKINGRMLAAIVNLRAELDAVIVGSVEPYFIKHLRHLRATWRRTWHAMSKATRTPRG